MILLHYGDQQKVKVKKDNLHKLNGGCDRAVELKQAEWKEGKARLWFHNIGQPSIATWASKSAPKSSCRMDHGEIEMELSGFAKDEPPDSVEAAVRQILLTPEQYLTSAGIVFDSMIVAGGDEVPVQCGASVTQPKGLLFVDPEYSDPARRAKYNGTLQVAIIVGADGRVHKPRISKALGMGLDEMALDVLPMWRFQPGTQAGKPVACNMSIEMSFNLY